MRRMLRLRGVLSLLLLVGLLPLLGLTVFGALDQRQEARRKVGQEGARLLRLASLRHGDLVDGGRDLLATIVRMPALRAGDGPACSSHLTELLALYPRYSTLGVVDRRGGLLCSAVPAPPSVNFADRSWFRRVEGTGGFSVGDYQIGRITGRPTVVYAMPVLDSGQMVAVAFAALDLGWLQQFATAAAGGGGGWSLFLADRTGTVLARHPDPEAWVGNQIPVALWRAIRGRESGSTEFEGPDGVSRLFVHARLGSESAPLAFVSAGARTSVVYAESNRALQRSLALLGALAILGLAAARLLADSFVVRPTRSLVSMARRLGVGELGLRVGPTHPPGELGEIGRAFDDMAAALEARDLELDWEAEQRRRGEERLRAILDHAPVTVSMTDPEGRLTMVNRRVEELTGMTQDQLLGRTVFDLFPEELALQIHSADLRALSGDHPVEAEIVVACAGGPRTYHLVAFPLADAAGVRYALVSMAIDISERVAALAERHALEDRLRQAERLESLGRLAGGVAHDFNNLLSVILNYADFAMGALSPGPVPESDSIGAVPSPGAGPSSEAIRDDLAVIVRAAESAASLTRQLLIFGRRDTTRAEMLDLNVLVTEMESMLRRTLEEGVKLETLLQPSLRRVQADAGRLEQVLVNLVVNARDATKSGGTLTVRTENLDLDADEARWLDLAPGPYVSLIVADDGAGMAPEVAARAFEPFFTTKSSGQGSGLGLATVYGAVAEAGGRVLLDSVPGRGTVVRVHLPAALQHLEVEQCPVQTEPESPGAETVLVVEDEEALRDLVVRILEGHGFDVIAPRSAAEALDICATHPGPIDLLLTDVVMPGLSGPELVGRGRDIRPGMLALYVSGYPADFLACHGVDEDAPMLRKPFDATSLLRTVRQLLDQVSLGQGSNR